MAFDGIITQAMTRELSDALLLGKIDNVYQPESDERAGQPTAAPSILHAFAQASARRPDH